MIEPDAILSGTGSGFAAGSANLMFSAGDTLSVVFVTVACDYSGKERLESA